MAASGPKYPGTVANLSNAGTAETAELWTNTGNVVSDNATEASIVAATYDSPDISQILVCSNFGFAIPTDATITGILVEIDRRSIIAGSGQDFRVQLATGVAFANLIGANKADTALTWPSTSTLKTYGGSSDMWTSSLTPAQANAAGFAVMVSTKALIANADVGIDYVRVTITYTGGTYDGLVLASSPKGYWKLDETAGTQATDSSGLAHHGTYTGSYTLNQTKVMPAGSGGSVDLSPTGPGLVSIADHADFDWANGPWTVEAWVYIDTAAADPGRAIISKGNGAPLIRVTNSPVSDIQLIRSHEAYIGDSGGGGLNITPPSGPRHIVVTYAGSNGLHAFYLDGAAHTGTVTANFVSNALALEIGRDVDECYFDGRIGNVAVYNTALSAATVADHYAVGSVAGGPPAVTGTGASAFGFSHAATGTHTPQAVTGTGASAFGFSTAATGSHVQNATGTAASAFGFATAATGSEGFTGTSASAFGWSTAATGSEGFSGAASATFGWSTSATAAEEFAGVQAVTFGYSTASTGIVAEAVTGTAASAFTFATAATGTHTQNVTGIADSAFGFSTTAAAVEAIPGTSASAFGWSTSASGTEGFTGTSASAFGWSTTAAATESIPGTSATTFGFSTASTGIAANPVTGTSAASFGWSHAASGTYVPAGTFGTAASAFGFSTSATGTQTIPAVTGTSAASFGWSTTATGTNLAPVTGTSASAFGWSVGATGASLLGISGTAASAFSFSSAATGTFVPPATEGVADSTFGWSTTGTGDHTPPYFAEPPPMNTITRQPTRSAQISKF